MTWRATVLTIFPEICRPACPLTRRQGVARGLWRLETVDIRDFARDKHRSSTMRHSARAGHGDAADVLDAAVAGARGVGRQSCSRRGEKRLDQQRVGSLAEGSG